MFYKISNAHHGCKVVDRYFQVSKTKIKYFKSIYSASVWNNKPLKIIDINEIENIELKYDELFKECHPNIELNFIIGMNDKFYEQSNKNKEEIFKVDEDFHFGFEEKEYGVTFMKILFFIKNILNS